LQRYHWIDCKTFIKLRKYIQSPTDRCNNTEVKQTAQLSKFCPIQGNGLSIWEHPTTHANIRLVCGRTWIRFSLETQTFSLPHTRDILILHLSYTRNAEKGIVFGSCILNLSLVLKCWFCLFEKTTWFGVLYLLSKAIN